MNLKAKRHNSKIKAEHPDHSQELKASMHSYKPPPFGIIKVIRRPFCFCKLSDQQSVYCRVFHITSNCPKYPHFVHWLICKTIQMLYEWNTRHTLLIWHMFELFKYNVNFKTFILNKSWLVKLIRHSPQRVVSSNPTMDKNVSFWNFRLFRVPRKKYAHKNEIKYDIHPR